MSYESVKIYDDDKELLEKIRLDRGLKLVEAFGCVVEGWDKLSRKEQDQIIRDRAQRQHGEPVAP